MLNWFLVSNLIQMHLRKNLNLKVEILEGRNQRENQKATTIKVHENEIRKAHIHSCFFSKLAENIFKIFIAFYWIIMLL